ncbi:glycine zipper family protein [bacterium]|nr:glycine zipper family protein [bacterium]
MKKIISMILCAIFVSFNLSVCSLAQEGDVVSVEHLQLPKKLYKKTPTDIINSTSDTVEIVSYNTLPVSFAQDFNSKYAKVGDEVVFILNECLKTREGTEVLPAGTKFVAEICDINKPKAFNRSGKVYLNFKYLELPDGTQHSIDAKLFNQKDFLSRGKLNALGKGLGSTLGGMAIGTGAGCGIGIAAGSVIIGGFAIGMPIGFAIGATAGLVTPGLYYKAKAGDKINIQLLDKVVIDK